ncbi:hypothetical protein GY45DRAFT_1329150 [Cubamyces sp. BRFM 1775]|nr:hypothetical protein GY45DRAFT_1329150 [Cubamyces sp. BRFM 1775]
MTLFANDSTTPTARLSSQSHQSENAGDAMDPILDKYLAIRRTCLYEYRAEPTIDDAYQFTQQGFAAHRLNQLRNDANSGNDIPLRLENALRCLSGWDTNTDGKVCPERALFHLHPIVHPKQDIGATVNHYCSATPPDTHPGLLRAHSIAAYAYLTKYYATADEYQMIAYDALCLPRDGGQIDPLDPLENILCAINRANWLASMQFVTPAVLMAGFAFKALVKRLGVDYEQFKHFRPLWRELDKRKKDLLEADRQKMRTKGRSLPGLDDCAAPTCTPQNPGMYTLVTPCYGPCPLETKPSYCSERCRTNDWPRHRGACCPRESTEIPPTLKLDRRTRDRLVSSIGLKGPVEQLERISDVEGNISDPQDGKVLWAFDIPSASDHAKLERYALKRYE